MLVCQYASFIRVTTPTFGVSVARVITPVETTRLPLAGALATETVAGLSGQVYQTFESPRHATTTSGAAGISYADSATMKFRFLHREF